MDNMNTMKNDQKKAEEIKTSVSYRTEYWHENQNAQLVKRVYEDEAPQWEEMQGIRVKYKVTEKKINQEVLEKVEEIREEVPVQETLVKEGYRAMYGNKKQSNKDRDKRMENISNRRAEGLEAKKVIKDYKDKNDRNEKILKSVLEEQNKKENKEELKSYAIHYRELAAVMSAFHLSEEELVRKAENLCGEKQKRYEEYESILQKIENVDLEELNHPEEMTRKQHVEFYKKHKEELGLAMEIQNVMSQMQNDGFEIPMERMHRINAISSLISASVNVSRNMTESTTVSLYGLLRDSEIECIRHYYMSGDYGKEKEELTDKKSIQAANMIDKLTYKFGGTAITQFCKPYQMMSFVESEKAENRAHDLSLSMQERYQKALIFEHAREGLNELKSKVSWHMLDERVSLNTKTTKLEELVKNLYQAAHGKKISKDELRRRLEKIKENQQKGIEAEQILTEWEKNDEKFKEDKRGRDKEAKEIKESMEKREKELTEESTEEEKEFYKSMSGFVESYAQAAVGIYQLMRKGEKKKEFDEIKNNLFSADKQLRSKAAEKVYERLVELINTKTLTDEEIMETAETFNWNLIGNKEIDFKSLINLASHGITSDKTEYLRENVDNIREKALMIQKKVLKTGCIHANILDETEQEAIKGKIAEEEEKVRNRLEEERNKRIAEQKEEDPDFDEDSEPEVRESQVEDRLELRHKLFKTTDSMAARTRNGYDKLAEKYFGISNAFNHHAIK